MRYGFAEETISIIINCGFICKNVAAPTWFLVPSIKSGKRWNGKRMRSREREREREREKEKERERERESEREEEEERTCLTQYTDDINLSEVDGVVIALPIAIAALH